MDTPELIESSMSFPVSYRLRNVRSVKLFPYA